MNSEIIKKSKVINDFLSKHNTEWREDMLTKLAIKFKTSKARDPVKNLKDRLTQVVHFFNFVEKYTVNKYKDYPKHVDPFKWFLHVCNKENTIELLRGYADDSEIIKRNVPVRSIRPVNTKRVRINRGLVLLKTHLREYLSCNEIGYLTTENIMADVEMSTVSEAPRSHFTDDELEALKYACVSMAERLMLLILMEVGLRVGALSGMEINNIFNADFTFKEVGSVREKGGVMRTFILSDNLKLTFKQFLTDYPYIKEANKYFFPKRFSLSHKLNPRNKIDYSRHIHQATLSGYFSKIAERADVRGPHVHLHAFRSTIVNKLMGEGNSISNVSKFIGHAHVSTTEQFYWTANIESVVKTMNIGWLNEKNVKSIARSFSRKSAGGSLDSIAYKELLNILMVVMKLLTPEQHEKLHTSIPNFDELMNLFSNLFDSTISVYQTDYDSSDMDSNF